MKQPNLLKRAMALVLGLVLGASALPAQNITVTGTVTDALKEPIIGASILQQGTTNGTATDVDGHFTLSVPAGSTLEISSIGFETRTLKATEKMDVILREDSELLNETVVVGYGVQKRESLTGAITQIRSEDIAATKTADGVAALQGKIPGLLVTQNSGKPGAFASDISLRGFGTPMVVVDGVVRSTTRTRKSTTYNTNPNQLESYTDLSVLQELNPDDIESISVLKDASATIYGLGAQNGVILITTKKGQVKKPSVTFSTNVSFAVPVVPRQVESWTSFMKWENAMSDVGKLGHRWEDAQIAAYESGAETWTSRDGKVHDAIYTDWYNEVYRKFAVNKQYNISIMGGDEKVNYYFGGSYADDNPILKGNTYGYNRYNFNGNISVRLLPELTMRYTTSVRQSSNTGMGDFDMDWNIFFYIYQSNPTVGVHPKNNPAHYTDVEEHCNPVALLDTDFSGFTKTDRKDFNNTLDFTYDAPFLKGLKFQATGAYDFGRSKQRTLVKKGKLYDYYEDTSIPGVQETRQETEYAEMWNDNTRVYMRGQALFDRQFGRHNVSAMVGAEMTYITNAMVGASRYYGADASQFLYTHDVIDQGLEARDDNQGTRGSSRTAGYIGRINYNYMGKYLVEIMGRYDGNYQFQRGHRWGLFPSYSVGWRISEEKFFKNIFPAVNNLKFRWSDGYTGSVQGSPYAYVNGYHESGSWVFSDGKTTTGYANNQVANTILTWAKVRMMDFGVDWELWQGKFGGTFDWFKREMIGTAATRSVSLPDFYAVSIPQENLNRNETQGLELTLYHRNSIGNFSYRIQGTASFTRSRNTYIESEKTRIYASQMEYWKSCNLNRWGGYMGGNTYHWTGDRFTSIDDASASQVLYSALNTNEGNRALIVGQYKLEDRNGNGYIDSDDVFYTWGGGMPPLQFGLTFSGSYKGFDFSLLFNGATMKYKSYGLSAYAGYGVLNYLPSHYTDAYHVASYGADPWDPATQWVDGYWPALVRLSQVGSYNSPTYGANQPYNYVNATFLRLKTIELGYRISPNFLKKAGIKSARVFFNGGNLLTICNPLLKYVDPESNDSGRAGGEFQINKTYSFGFNLNF
ncbi:MAG: TonB-dependent receptor [Bacteroidales bacterium]|nr:TonB-dependent receptor [Bacteroidales bacterium]